MINPFFSAFNTPFNVPDFNVIKEEHFIPAYEKAIEIHNKEILAITGNEDPPSFENTLAALDQSGIMLRDVDNVFDNLKSSNTNDKLNEIAKEMAPVLAEHRDDINMNPDLFKRIKSVYDRNEEFNLTPEQLSLLDQTYKDFVRGGANLSKSGKQKLRDINKELSVLTIRFGDNVLSETNNYKLILESEDDLNGLPGSLLQSAAEAAKDAGLDGKWVFTLQRPSIFPFLQYSERRDLREKIFMAYIMRGNNMNEYDNREIISRIISLRVEKAHLLGYVNHAEYILEKNMAKNPDNVYKLLNDLWVAALPVAQREADALQAIISREGGEFKLKPWDWWYYAEKLRKEKYDLEESLLRPYFKLQNVRNGLFDVCNKLYGLQFRERNDIPKYHEDVQVFEVLETDGSHIGILYMDFHPRFSKQGGAWMSSYRKQYRINGENITPVITTNFNFTMPTAEMPALLNLEEVKTMYHEMGHALHGLLSNCNYYKLSGTAVPRDFVELPSQIMENWALEPEVMMNYALHFETGAPIPEELINKIKNSQYFNQGFQAVEYLAASFLDMDWHTLLTSESRDVNKFETESMKKIGIIPEIVVRYRSSYFNHIFSGGYSAGYYSYIWAEVLDSDAFEAFKETSLFDRETALSFRKNILERGGSEDPMELYLRFRGKEPSIESLLKRRGFKPS